MAGKTEQLQIRVTARQKATLRRLARTAGQDVSTYVLARALPAVRDSVADIVRTLRHGEDHRLTLAELNDAVHGLTPNELAEAGARIDVRSLSPFLQNYVAA